MCICVQCGVLTLKVAGGDDQIQGDSIPMQCIAVGVLEWRVAIPASDKMYIGERVF